MARTNPTNYNDSIAGTANKGKKVVTTTDKWRNYCDSADKRRNVATSTYKWRTNYSIKLPTNYISFSSDLIATTVTCSPKQVCNWIWEVKRHSAEEIRTVGLDTEWRPYNKGHTVAVLQLCVGSRCLVYRIFNSTYVPQALAEFLAEEKNIFVGVAVKNDLQKLQADFQIGDTANHEDLRDMAVRVYEDKAMKNIGLKRLTAKVLNVEMEKEKEVTVSQWDGWLTKKQIRYACHDAVASYQIGRALRMKLEEESSPSNGNTYRSTPAE